MKKRIIELIIFILVLPLSILTVIQIFILMPIYYIKTGKSYMDNKDPWFFEIYDWILTKIFKS